MAELFIESRSAMGTDFEIYLYARDRIAATAAFEAAFEEIDRLDETLSNYRETSELSRINRLAASEAVTTDPEVFELLQSCVLYSQQSDGAFDITVGPLMRAWGFFRGQGRYPNEEELRHARQSVGWNHLQLDPATRTVRFAVPGLELDLGAVGKGYAVDRAVKVLREAGVKAALVNAGSSTLHAFNAPPGKNGWIVRVPWPGVRDQTISTLTLCNESLSTSGSYEKFFELEGVRHCHVMDPRRGVPVESVLQTTLVAGDSTTTDALSNAIFVMGPKAGKELLAGLPGSRGLWIVDDSGRQRIFGCRWPEYIADRKKPKPPVSRRKVKVSNTR